MRVNQRIEVIQGIHEGRVGHIVAIRDESVRLRRFVVQLRNEPRELWFSRDELRAAPRGC
jgi:hypothetical protein